MLRQETPTLREMRRDGLVGTVLLIALGPVTAWADWPAEWHPLLYPVPASTVFANAIGLNPDPANSATRNDVTEIFQSALAALKPGQTLYLAPGVYNVHQPLLIPSGVAVQGPQDSGGHPLATIHQTAKLGEWGPGKLKLGVLMNAHYNAPLITDSGITITAVEVDDDSYGVLFRMVRDVRVQGCDFEGGGDGAAFLASADTVVSATLVRRTINAAFDYWDGDTNATVENSVAFLAGGYGISFNSVDTDGSSRTSGNLTATNNIITGAGNDTPAITVDPVGQSGARITGDITIANNRIYSPQPRARTGGIFVSTGDAKTVTIKGNYVAGSSGYPPILVTGYRLDRGFKEPGAPTRTYISANVVENNAVDPAHGAVIRAEGQNVQISNNTVRGNAFANGTPAPFVMSSGRVHAWDNHLSGVAGGEKTYNVPRQRLTLQRPPTGSND